MSSPSPQEARSWLIDVIAGRATREAAADWASGWVSADDPAVEDPATWKALTELSGIDLLEEPGVYFHSELDIHQWLDELEDSIQDEE